MLKWEYYQNCNNPQFAMSNVLALHQLFKPARYTYARVYNHNKTRFLLYICWLRAAINEPIIWPNRRHFMRAAKSRLKHTMCAAEANALCTSIISRIIPESWSRTPSILNGIYTRLGLEIGSHCGICVCRNRHYYMFLSNIAKVFSGGN